MVDFLFALIELFRYPLQFRSYEAKRGRLFSQGVDLFALKFYVDMVVHQQPKTIEALQATRW